MKKEDNSCHDFLLNSINVWFIMHCSNQIWNPFPVSVCALSIVQKSKRRSSLYAMHAAQPTLSSSNHPCLVLFSLQIMLLGLVSTQIGIRRK